MTRSQSNRCFPLVFSLLVLPSLASAQAISLRSAASYGVLGGSTVTSAGLTVIIGDLGVSPGTAITGFGPGVFTGAIHAGDAAAMAAHADAATAFGSLGALTSTHDLSGVDLGGKTLFPGVYHFNTTAQLTGALFLDSGGETNPQFVFQIGTALNTAIGSSVTFIGGPSTVFWRVGSSAVIGGSTAFTGSILADQSITLGTDASVLGRAIALNGAVTLDSNHVTVQAVPEPGTVAALSLGLVWLARRRKLVRRRVSR